MKNYKIILMVALVITILAGIFTSIGLYFGNKTAGCLDVVRVKESAIQTSESKKQVDNDKSLAGSELSKFYWRVPNVLNANKMELFVNPSRNIKFIIPYNDEWVDPNYRYPIRAYQFQHYGMQLVPIAHEGQNTWLLHYDILPHFEPQITDEVVKVGNFDVIKSVEEELCYHPKMVVIGDEYNYIFSSICAENDEQIQRDFAYMEAIIKSIEIIENLESPMVCPTTGEKAKTNKIGRYLELEETWIECAGNNWWYDAHEIKNIETDTTILFYKMSNSGLIWQHEGGGFHELSPLGDVDWVKDFDRHGVDQPATLKGFLLDGKVVDVYVNPITYEDGSLGGFQGASFGVITIQGDDFVSGILNLQNNQSFSINLRTAEITKNKF